MGTSERFLVSVQNAPRSLLQIQQEIIDFAFKLLLAPPFQSLKKLWQEQRVQGGLSRLRDVPWGKWFGAAFSLLWAKWTSEPLRQAYQAVQERVERDLNALKTRPNNTENEQAIIKMSVWGFAVLKAIIGPFVQFHLFGIVYEKLVLIKSFIHLGIAAGLAALAPQWLCSLHAQLLRLPIVVHVLLSCVLFGFTPYLVPYLAVHMGWFVVPVIWTLRFLQLLAVLVMPGTLHLVAARIFLSLAMYFLSIAFGLGLSIVGSIFLGISISLFMSALFSFFTAFLPIRFGFVHQALLVPQQFFAQVADSVITFVAHYRNTDTKNDYQRKKAECINDLQQMLGLAKQYVCYKFKFKSNRAIACEQDKQQLWKKFLEKLSNFIFSFEVSTAIKLPLIVTPEKGILLNVSKPLLAINAEQVLEHYLADRPDQTGFQRAFACMIWSWIADAWHAPFLIPVKEKIINLAQEQLAPSDIRGPQ